MVETNIWVALVLFVFGLCAGSFVNALVWRVHEQNKKNKKTDKSLSVIQGRSICPNCRHVLASRDLIPMFSWLMLKGRCRYCKKSISVQYPIIELTGGIVFVTSYLYWPFDIAGLGDKTLFVSWLLTAVGLLALLVYDYRWMLLPNRILYPTAAASVLGRLIYIAIGETDKVAATADWAVAVGIASGLFWAIFHLSKGKWIGYGDVRLGIITGTILATPGLSLLMIFVASVIGTLVILPSLILGRKGLTARIPFGPFLIAATFLVLLFGQSVIDWYLDLALQG